MLFSRRSFGSRICLQCRKPRFSPWVGNIPWRREWEPTPVFLPGEPHGQRNLAGFSPWGHKESDTTERLTLHYTCGTNGKEPICQCRRHKRCGFNPWISKIPLEEGLAIHSTILTWRIPWTEEPGRLQSIGSQRVGHDWSNLACRHTTASKTKVYYLFMQFLEGQVGSAGCQLPLVQGEEGCFEFFSIFYFLLSYA